MLEQLTTTRSHLALALGGLCLALGLVAPVLAAGGADFELVPEMVEPPRIEAQPKAQRQALQDSPGAVQGLIGETRVRFGSDSDPRVTFDGETAAQSQTTGNPCFETPNSFSADVTFPEAGTFFLTPVARVDSSLLGQNNPSPPSTTPQSWLVRSRTEDGLLEENSVEPTEVNRIVAQQFWGAVPLEITVGGGDLVFEDGFESGDTTAW